MCVVLVFPVEGAFFKEIQSVFLWKEVLVILKNKSISKNIVIQLGLSLGFSFPEACKAFSHKTASSHVWAAMNLMVLCFNVEINFSFSFCSESVVFAHPGEQANKSSAHCLPAAEAVIWDLNAVQDMRGPAFLEDLLFQAFHGHTKQRCEDVQMQVSLSWAVIRGLLEANTLEIWWTFAWIFNEDVYVCGLTKKKKEGYIFFLKLS